MSVCDGSNSVNKNFNKLKPEVKCHNEPSRKTNMDHMEHKSIPEATLHAYKTNHMKNNKGITNAPCIFMSAKPYIVSILYGVISMKKGQPKHMLFYTLKIRV